MDGMIKVNPGAIVDYNAALGTFSGELDNIASEAQNLLGGIAEYFTTDQASVTEAIPIIYPEQTEPTHSPQDRPRTHTEQQEQQQQQAQDGAPC